MRIYFDPALLAECPMTGPCQVKPYKDYPPHANRLTRAEEWRVLASMIHHDRRKQLALLAKKFGFFSPYLVRGAASGLTDSRK